MNPIEIAHSAHLQTLRSLRVHKEREILARCFLTANLEETLMP